MPATAFHRLLRASLLACSYCWHAACGIMHGPDCTCVCVSTACFADHFTYLTPFPAPQPTDAQLLLAFRDSLDNGRQMLSSWTGTDPCQGWVGISCDGAGGRVATIDLEGRNLSGKLPPGGWTFPSRLKTLSLRENRIRGTFSSGKPCDCQLLLPRHLSACFAATHMQSPKTETGGLQGAKLPCKPLFRSFTNASAAGWVLPQLSYLDLGNNLISGTIPPAWDLVIGLSSISLDSNRLTGALPEDWALPVTYLNLGPYTSYLDVRNNQLEGERRELASRRSVRHGAAHGREWHGQPAACSACPCHRKHVARGTSARSAYQCTKSTSPP